MGDPNIPLHHQYIFWPRGSHRRWHVYSVRGGRYECGGIAASVGHHGHGWSHQSSQGESSHTDTPSLLILRHYSKCSRTVEHFMLHPFHHSFDTHHQHNLSTHLLNPSVNTPSSYDASRCIALPSGQNLQMHRVSNHSDHRRFQSIITKVIASIWCHGWRKLYPRRRTRPMCFYTSGDATRRCPCKKTACNLMQCTYFKRVKHILSTRHHNTHHQHTRLLKKKKTMKMLVDI